MSNTIEIVNHQSITTCIIVTKKDYNMIEAAENTIKIEK